jgi:integrase
VKDVLLKKNVVISIFRKKLAAKRQIDRERGILIVERTKDKRPKIVPLIDEDIELLKAIPQGLPDLPFFRHTARPYKGKVVIGQCFGYHLFYTWWRRACANLGIEGVDLYGGSRHSTAMGLIADGCSPEQIKRATMHSTSKAFDRYLAVEGAEVKATYTRSRGVKKVPGPKSDSKVVDILSKKN